MRDEENMLNRFLIFFLLSLSSGVYAQQPSHQTIPDYTLTVSFDLRASKMAGVARIPVNKGQELRIDRGRLNLIFVTLDKEEIAIPGGDEKISILPPVRARLRSGTRGFLENLLMVFMVNNPLA